MYIYYVYIHYIYIILYFYFYLFIFSASFLPIMSHAIFNVSILTQGSNLRSVVLCKNNENCEKERSTGGFCALGSSAMCTAARSKAAIVFFRFSFYVFHQSEPELYEVPTAIGLYTAALFPIQGTE